MQTYSHLIITAALDQRYKDHARVEVNSRALLLGSVLPDVPLVILTLIFIAQYLMFGEAMSIENLFGVEYDTLYFNDPIWIIGHAMFHAPLMIFAYLAVGYWFGIRRGRVWAKSLFWFAIGCALHSGIDILTHHNDGPLLFFPFDWQTRFQSPVSYWDPRNYGDVFATFEHLLDIALIIGMIWLRRKRKLTAGSV